MEAGHKRRYRKVDFRRARFDVPATVERLEYDPNRSAHIALVRYEDGEQSYILAPQRLGVGDRVVSGSRVDIQPGNAMPLQNIPVGTVVHNIEFKAGAGGRIARSAGAYAQLIGKDQGYAQLRLKSGEMRVVRGECMATIGAVSNPEHQNRKLGKAGRSRWLGKRPLGARRRDEPGGPSPWRRRGADKRRASSRDTVGQADQGCAYAFEEGQRQADHRPPPPQKTLGDPT